MEKPIIFFEKIRFFPHDPELIGLFSGKDTDVLVWEGIPLHNNLKNIDDKEKILRLFGIEIKMPEPEIPTPEESLDAHIKKLQKLKQEAREEYDNKMCIEIRRIADRIVEYIDCHFGRLDKIFKENLEYLKENFLGEIKIISCSCASDKERQILQDSGINYYIWPCWTEGRYGIKKFDCDMYLDMVRDRINTIKASDLS